MKKLVSTIVATLFASAISVFAALPQVWDFGAEQFPVEQYENMLSEATINGAFTAEAGSTGQTISNLDFGEANFVFNGGGKNNHRLRTTNTNLTRYDVKSLTSTIGVKGCTGYIYSNASGNVDVFAQQTYSINDKVEFYVSSNGGNATYVLESLSSKKEEQLYESANKLQILTFYIKEDGAHKLYCTDEKLCLGRVIRTPAEYVNVSGAVTAPASIPADYKLRFVNKTTGHTVDVTPEEGAYVASLAKGFEYEVFVADNNTFVVKSGDVNVTGALENENVEIEAVTLFEQTGKINGLSAEALAKLSFSITLPEGKVYEPEVIINTANETYSVYLESGVEYGIEAKGINDYSFDKTKIGAITAANTADFTFTEKQKYTVTIIPTGATVSDLSAATFTFTNLNEEGYVYTFTGTEGIALRDGVYSVKVSNTGAYSQLLTSNLNVDGGNVEKTIDFDSNITKWDFAAESFTTGGYTSTSTEYNYNGLVFSGGKSHNSKYLNTGVGATISVPVKGACKIVVEACYSYGFKIGDNVWVEDTNTGSTSQIDVFEYNYTGEAGVVTFTTTSTSYICSIEVVSSIEYKEVVTVGVDKDYETINDALAAIRQMTRTADQRVTVKIDPGNYEEMLVVDVANVTFANASENPSIAIKDAGVNIDENAVRITGYYGHGYHYYSMGSDYKWNARTLDVNKENGYYSVENPGGGPTFWNATVAVTAKNFIAENIIFENSFNQYISAKEALDVVINGPEGKGDRPTGLEKIGNTDVQLRSYRERACAIAFSKNSDCSYLNNCRIIGRQDALYGDQGCRVAINGGVLMGACDYIFGGMTLAVKEAKLAFLVEENNNDVVYITAPKNTSGRGYLFYGCTVTSAIPGVEMATATSAKPGYFGRPWDTKGEAIFVNTIVEKTEDPSYSGSMIIPAGWNSGLSGESPNCMEFGTQELSGVDNLASRVTWAKVLPNTYFPETETYISLKAFTEGTDGWNPFNCTSVSNAVEKTSQNGLLKNTIVYDNLNFAVDVCKVIVISAMGAEMLRQDVTTNFVSVSGFVPGFYIAYGITKNGEVFVDKFIKQ